jgi:hypothetical protein
MKKYITILFISLFTINLFANDISQQIKPGELVIYNGGYSLYTETRTFTSNAKIEKLKYPDVAKSIITDSISINFDKNIKVLTQQYNYNTISLKNIANYYIGKKIKYKDKDVILKAVSPIIIETKNGIQKINNYNDITFEKIPQDMTDKPYLEWNIESYKKEKVKTTVRYLIEDISWKSNYVFNINGKKGHLDGWIDIKNHSGKIYNNSIIKIVTGDINRKINTPKYRGIAMAAAYEPVTKKEVQGYHLYNIPFKITLANKQNTQVHFLKEEISNHKKSLHFDIVTSPERYTNKGRYKCIQSINFDGLSQSIPSGKIRVYDSKENIFLGSDDIDNKIKNEKFSIDIGKDINVILKTKILKITNNKKLKTRKVKYNIKNGSNSKKSIILNIALHHFTAKIDKKLKNISKDNIYLKIPIELNPQSQKEFIINFEKTIK